MIIVRFLQITIGSELIFIKFCHGRELNRVKSMQRQCIWKELFVKDIIHIHITFVISFLDPVRNQPTFNDVMEQATFFLQGSSRITRFF